MCNGYVSYILKKVHDVTPYKQTKVAACEKHIVSVV